MGEARVTLQAVLSEALLVISNRPMEILSCGENFLYSLIFCEISEVTGVHRQGIVLCPIFA